MKRKPMNVYVKRVLAGLMIGVGGILPGVSGSVLAVAFGLYGPMLDAIATFFKDVKGNLKLLAPIGLGGAAGIYGVSVILDRVMGKYEVPLIFLFCGLVAGSVPSLVREAKTACGGLKKRYLLATAAGFLLMLTLLVSERMESAAQSAGSVGPAQALISGAILAVGSILPGLSTSFILIRLGWYAPMMNALSSLNLSLLVWAGLGALAAAAVTIGLVRMLLRRFPGWTYFLVMGFLAGSVVASIPRVALQWQSLFYVLIAAAGAIAAYLMASFSDSGTAGQH